MRLMKHATLSSRQGVSVLRIDVSLVIDIQRLYFNEIKPLTSSLPLLSPLTIRANPKKLLSYRLYLK